MQDAQRENRKKRASIWAVGGGKGGVGKSVVSTLMGFWLAKMGHRTILVDADLGGANLHILLGIKSPPKTVNDYIIKKFASLEEICIHTPVDKLRLMSGASEILSLANLQFAQKNKIIQGLAAIDADYIILDLGAGTSYNVLDFFLAAHRKIVVTSPQPVAIQNAYAFVRNAVYRRLSRLTSQKPSLSAIVKSAMNPRNSLQVRTLNELLIAVESDGNQETAAALARKIAGIQPMLITNMVKVPRDENAGRIVQMVSEKYLGIQPVHLGGIPLDNQLNDLVSSMTPLNNIEQSSRAFEAVYHLTSRLL